MNSVSPQPPHDPIAIALQEDIASGDLTCEFFVPKSRTGKARIFCKENAVAAGIDVSAETFLRLDPRLTVKQTVANGDHLKPGDTVLEIAGSVRSILTAERVALNFIQRLSGIATLTRRFVDAISGTRAKILDTRKTTPGLRAFEKAAVKAGGGVNHRFGLFDMVMVKDNHLSAEHAADALQQSIYEIQQNKSGVRIELEADTLEQVRAFLALEGVDVILLDNMSCDELREAVRLARAANRQVQLEASGGVNLETVRGIAETGVDFISVGALTHSAPSVDYSLELL